MRLLLALWGAALLCTVQGVSNPNILFIVIDDFGYTDSSVQGAEFTTPNIDALAKEGVRLTNYYVQQVCSPTRSAMMSGVYPFNNGLQFGVLIPASTAHVPMNRTLLPNHLKANSYDTHMIGKWHLGYSKWDYTPTGRGFDSHYGYFQGQEDYYNKTLCAADAGIPFPICGYDFWRNQKLERHAPEVGTYSASLYTKEADAIIQTHQKKSSDKPLFLYLAWQDVHVPLEAPPEYVAMCDDIKHPKRKIFCGMAKAVDASIGKVVAAYKAAGLWDNTLVVVSTDNGGMPMWGGPEDSVGCNYPLRGGKATNYEGGLRGFGLIAGAGIPPALKGTTSKAMMHAVDWLPTLMTQVSGATPPTGIDGMNLWPALTNPTIPSPRTWIPHNIDIGGKDDTAIRVGDWKLMVGLSLYDGWYPAPPAAKIPAPDANHTLHLFNIAEDPNEHHNLAEQNPNKVKELQARIAEIVASPGYNPGQNNLPEPAGLSWLHDGVWAPWQKNE